MQNLNKMMIIGKLGAAPELRELADGKKVAKLSIATNAEWKDKEGNSHKRTTWHKAHAWGPLGESAARYLQKGSSVYVEGELLNHAYTDKDGVNRKSWEIKANQITFLGTPPSGIRPKDSEKIEMPVMAQ